MTATIRTHTSFPNDRNAARDVYFSFLTLRQAIGCFGFIMPILVHLGGWVRQDIPLANSISAYYYSDMRDVFVSTLVLVGVLLACYRASTIIETWIARIAGLSAIGIGIFPMARADACVELMQYSDVCKLIDRSGPSLHFTFVLIFFALIFYLVFVEFPKSALGQAQTPAKIKRNRIYRACAITMFVSCLLIVWMHFTGQSGSIFYPESVAVMAFAYAWLTKGRSFFNEETDSAALFSHQYS